MKKPVKTPTKAREKGDKTNLSARSSRKNSNASTRNEGRQRSGNNGPQQGSH